MADQTATPLTDDERAELEALRAEKARRIEEERARAERMELEALRAEREHLDASSSVEHAADGGGPAEPATSRAGDEPAAANAPACEKKSFGERMVTSDALDDDGIPTMPIAQKLIIAAALTAVVAFIIYTVTH